MTTEQRKVEDVLCYDGVIGDKFIASGIKMPPANTIQIDKCEKIVLRQSGIDVKFELNNDNIRKFKQMYINGIGFVRSEAFCEELEDRLPKNIKTSVMEIF